MFNNSMKTATDALHFGKLSSIGVDEHLQKHIGAKSSNKFQFILFLEILSHFTPKNGQKNPPETDWILDKKKYQLE